MDTKFEIGKAEFTCTIRNVTPTRRTGTDIDEGEDNDEERATEIYLPLVQFASQEVLENTRARWDPEQSVKKVVGKLGMEPGPKMYGLERAPDLDAVDSHNTRGGRREKRFLESMEHQPDLLDVEVKVPSGTSYKIRGQTLYWWYPHRTSDSAAQDGEARVTIEVKRRGGAIKVRNGGWVEDPLQVRRSSMGGKSWCERLCDCDLGCVVM